MKKEMKKGMKKVLFLVLVYLLLLIGLRSVNAQVTIGNLQDPHSGAVLDLSQVDKQNLGLLLPRVLLTKTDEWQLNGNSDDGIGMVVYNMNECLESGRGLYLWNGVVWDPIKVDSNSGSVLVTDFKVTLYSSTGGVISSTNAEISVGGTIAFVISGYIPVNAALKSVIFSVVGGNDVIEFLDMAPSGCMIRGLKQGNAQILITSEDLNKSETVNIIVK
jgi:hypothetical protein